MLVAIITAALDQDDYHARYNGLVERYDRAQARINNLEKQRTDRIAKTDAIGVLIFRLCELNQPVDHFDSRLWLDVIDCVTVPRGGMLTFKFQAKKKSRCKPSRKHILICDPRTSRLVVFSCENSGQMV